MPYSKTAPGMVVLLLAAAGLHACGGGGMSGPAAPAAPGVTLSRAFPGISFVEPVRLLQAPRDTSRWFIVEKRGMVWVFDNDPGVVTATPFIDITARVDATPNEAGLLGMAFHPDWGVNGRYELFLSYTGTAAPLLSHVSRFFSLDNGITLDSGVEQGIITVSQPFVNHNGGNIEFGPDGYLYIGWGDGGGAGDPLDNAQDTHNLLGSIVRVDVDAGTPYTVPVDNPFATNPACAQGAGSAPCPEIFAWGLRNPWRWSFDSTTGTLWAGDVGQGAVEEVDVIVPGGNYGWRCREGTRVFDTSGNCPSGLIEPITVYDHGTGRSITGGYVYRGAAIPGLYGSYVFGDFSTGRIWALPASSGTGSTAGALLDSGLLLSAFAESADGELYALDYATGGIYQLTAAP